MDFGTALSVALTAPVLVELAKGVAAWLARTHDSKVTITCPDGTVAAENITIGSWLSCSAPVSGRTA